MPYSVKQISAFSGLTENSVRKNIYDIPAVYKLNDSWRVSAGNLAEYFLDNPKYLKAFRYRLETTAIPSRYRNSAIIFSNILKEREDARLNVYVPMMRCTDITSLGVNHKKFRETRNITNLCAKRKIIAYKKVKNNRFSTWIIPTESFAIYLRQNGSIEKAFTDRHIEMAETWRKENPEMFKLSNSIQKALNRVKWPSEDTVSIDDLSDIFDLPKNQLLSIFSSGQNALRNFRAKVIAPFSNAKIPISDIYTWLDENPKMVERLENKWAVSIDRNPYDPDKFMIGHILTLYNYHRFSNSQ